MASTTILSDNGASSGSAGLKETGGNDGVLILQTTTSGGTATTAVTIDTSQNLGLGVTPSAWVGNTALQVGSVGAVSSSATGGATLSYNAYSTSAGWSGKYIADGYASIYEQVGGAHYWLKAASGTAGNAISFTQAMTLDASGRLNIAQTSAPSAFPAILNIKSSASAASAINLCGRGGDNLSDIYFTSADGATSYANIEGGPTYLAFGTNGSERARIDSSGNLLVGTTSNSSTGLNNGGVVLAPTYQQICVGATSGTAAYFYTKGASSVVQAGTITVSTNTAAYNSGSDYRLKEQIEPLNNALNTVSLLKPSKWLWKSNGEYGNGFIAHELAEVCPQAVSGEKDAVDADGNPQYQGVDTSFLVATLTAAIQELKAELDAAKARITTLEAA